LTDPALSVVLVTDTFETIRRTVEHLERQSISDRLELVIAARDVATLGLDRTAIAPFHSVNVVEVPSTAVIGLGRAVAMRAAASPIVLVGETHSFPEPSALETLLERHREPWAVVGMAVKNGNGDSVIGWSSVLMDYGSQLAGTPGGEVARIASHNGSYKRSALLELGPELEQHMGAGDVLNDALVARGGRLYLEADARTAHFNVSRFGSWVRERLAAGKSFAGYRGRDWPASKRAVYAIGAPAIPFIRFARIRTFATHAGLSGRAKARIYPTLAVGLVLSALGELAGYVAGTGSSEEAVSAMELHRRPHLRADDQVVFDEA
jgi:hypothetical protein